MAVVALSACQGDDGGSAVNFTSSTVMELPSVASQQSTVSFTATADWTVTLLSDWVSVSPRRGSAGSHTLTLTTASTNRTKTTRTAQLTITAGGDRRSVSLIQSSKYAIFDQKEYSVDAIGGQVMLTFKSNIEQTEDIGLRYSRLDWLHWIDESRRATRAEWTGNTIPINIDANTTGEGRVAMFLLTLPADSEEGWMGLDTAYIYQPPVRDDYTSADYSADGTVTLMQQATAGRGIPIVIMGDGFADVDVADGTYRQVMEQSMENLFSEEPVRSLRDYFTVYAVTAVSRNRGVGSDRQTVFSTVPSYSSSDIAYNQDEVVRYTTMVDNLDFDHALSVVIVNSSSHNGVTALMSNVETKEPGQYAIALCSLMEGVESERFRQVLTHEAIGHGLAKLADEYGYESNGGPTADEISLLGRLHRYQWMTNVDTTDDPSKVLWAPFIGDSRYSSEAIGLYEGAYTYTLDVYRPTEESMMRGNESPFNAPSRKAIYDKVMLLGEGRAASTHDEFAAFDAQHKPQRWHYGTSATRSLWQEWRRRLVPPKMLNFN